MKHFTKLMLATMALGASATVSAQSDVFKVELSYRDVFVPMHRAIPSVVDYNNDGNNDVIYGGQNASDHVTKGQEQVFDENGDPVLDDEGNPTYREVVVDHDQWAYYDAENDRWDFLGWQCTANLYTGLGDGKFEGDRGFSWHQWGEGSRIGTGAKSLLPSTYGFYRWHDFDNDGFLDAYVVSRSEWGWNWSWNAHGFSVSDGWFAELQRYNPETDKFEVVANTPFPYGNNEIDTWEEGGAGNSWVTFGDYNNDGYVDVLVQCLKRWVDGEEQASARYVGLFKNNGDGTFTEQLVFNPLPYESNPQPGDLFQTDEETFETVPTYKARPATHGAIRFGDLNNDGFLDIIYTGWSNNESALTFTVYKNNGDGTFDEVDLSGKGFIPTFEGDIALADINNDGWLDIISYGFADGWGRRADIYLNNGEGDFTFTLSDADNGNGLYGSNRPHLVAVDINHDGRVDLVASGWSEIDGKAATRVFYQTAAGTYELAQDISTFDSGEFTVGDINGDGAVDLLGDFWGRENDSFGPEYDGASFVVMLGQETEGIEAPEAPTNVTATEENAKLTVKWTGDESELGYSYNVYVKAPNGKIYSIVPANIETGKLLSTQDIQVALRSAEPAEMSYTIDLSGKGNGEYEVGVQTIKPDWTSSAFTKVKVDVANGIQGTQFIGTTQTQVYNANGVYVGNTTNNLKHGLYIVKQGSKTTKVMK